MIAGSAACLLAMYMYIESSRAFIRAGLQKTSPFPASILIIAFGGIVAMVGFFLSWNSGSTSSLWFDTVSWSNYGFEVSVPMYLIPIGVVLSFMLLILNLSVRQMMSLVFLQITQNFLTVGLALALFWGLAFGEFEALIPDYYIKAKLQPGWYLCMIGELMMIVPMLLGRRFREAASGNLKSLNQQGAAESTLQ